MAEETRSKQSQEPDGSEPSQERQVALRAAYEANVAAGRAPYQGVRIRTRGELQWIMHERNWSAAGVLEDGQARADLSGADFYRANLSGANLLRANLHEAVLFRASLGGADLRFTNLSGALLAQSHVSGADLTRARMDVATALDDVTLDVHTRLGDIIWNGAPLTRVDWRQIPRLGDEQAVAEAKTRRDRITAYRNAARAYRGLALALREQGLLILASGYRLREQRLERRAQRLERKYLGWFFSGLLDLVAGYGERPGRAFWAYVTVVLTFTSAYFGIAYLDPSLSHVAWYDWPALSITSFHGRGFFPGTLPPSGWVTLLALAEAIIGLFLELVFIATFSRRFLGN